MAFQDDASKLLELFSEKVADADDAEVQVVQRLVELFSDVEGADIAAVRSAGMAIADRAAQLLRELGEHELAQDPHAVIFAAMTAVSGSVPTFPTAEA